MSRNLKSVSVLAVAVQSLAWMGCVSQGATRETSQASVRVLSPECTAHEQLNAVLWMQQSAEYRAAALQAFSLAGAALDEALSDPSEWRDAVSPGGQAAEGNYAVIVDIDETILDNSRQAAQSILAGKHKFDEAAWQDWESMGSPDEIRGAGDFLRAAAGRGVTVFYVTNRTDEKALRKTLGEVKFPLTDKTDTVLVKGEFPTGASKSNKEGRRIEVARSYRVLIEIGDDLSDFADITGLSLEERAELVDRAKTRWGREWIVIPNPAYGSWERVYYGSADDEPTMIAKKCRSLKAPGSAPATR
jgi:5'-nucleotidase (lipoprotein e(P4) family)